MRRTHRPPCCKRLKTRKRRTAGEPTSAGSGRNLAFRWWRFNRACYELYCELRDQLAVKVGWTSDPSQPQVPASERDNDEPRGPSPWPAIVFWAVLIAFPLASYYGFAPARRVVDTTYLAASKAVDKEVNPPPKESVQSEREMLLSSITTILPNTNLSEAYEALLRWLRDRRPEFSLKQRLDEIDLIDGMITSEVKCMASSALSSDRDDEAAGIARLTIRSACTAGDASSEWLVLALAGEEPDSVGCTFVVQCSHSFYDYQLLTPHPGSGDAGSPANSGTPWLKSVDLDGDGSREIIQTWRHGLRSEMSLQVYKWVDRETGWKPVLSVPHVYLGQVRIVHSDPASLPQLLLAEGVASEAGEDDGELAHYRVSVFSWDRKSRALKKKTSYIDQGQFDPAEVGGHRRIVPKLLGRQTRSRLDSHFKDGWLCSDVRSINGYQVLTLLNAPRAARADSAWVVILDPAGKVRLACSGATYGLVGLHSMPDLDGDGRPEAVIECDGGGAHGNMDYFVCAFYPKFRLLAGVHAGRGSILDIKDMNHDGAREIMVTNDCFDQFDDLPCADTPFTVTVLSLRDQRCEDATSSFPSIARADMAEARAQLRRELLRDSIDPTGDLGDCALESIMIRWLANAAILGEGDTAYSEMMSILPMHWQRSWLSRNRSAIVATVRGSGSRISYRAPAEISQ